MFESGKGHSSSGQWRGVVPKTDCCGKERISVNRHAGKGNKEALLMTSCDCTSGDKEGRGYCNEVMDYLVHDY